MSLKTVVGATDVSAGSAVLGVGSEVDAAVVALVGRADAGAFVAVKKVSRSA